MTLLTVFAQAASQTPAAEEAPLLSPIWVFIIALSLLALPFALGSIIARVMKMKDFAMRISVVLLAAELGLAPFVSEYVRGALEESQYDKKIAHYNEKEAARKNITEAGIAELKKANPQLQIQYRLSEKDSKSSAGK